MEVDQRLKELRTMFLQLSEIILEEAKAGNNIQSSQTYIVMKKILKELEKLERENGIDSN